MNERYDVELREYNTLNLNGTADRFFTVFDENELLNLFNSKLSPSDDFRVLGGGSNIWISSESIPVVIQLNNKGVLIKKSGNMTYVNVKAGEEWPVFIDTLVSNGIGGLEALSDIPGTVGAAPIQNIGAYGVEVSDRIKYVKVFDISKCEFKIIKNKDCYFSYRNSIFKKQTTLIVVEVAFEFEDDYVPSVKHLDVLKYLDDSDFTIENVSKSIKAIRKSKLPDPTCTPNAGSFFKNPIVTEDKLAQVKTINGDVVFYELNNGYKISAAWLIEQSGWKGKLLNGIGMSPKHALVLTNTSSSIDSRIDEYVALVKNDVLKKFKVELEVEPVCW